jgi:membrane associated rhomboid family serine protease
MATCYRHPGRETGVSCSNCGRPICPDCMTPTSVGMRCPECARQRTQVRTLRSTTHEPVVTYALIAINVAAFIASTVAGGGLANRGGGTVIEHGALNGPAIADQHEFWRLITSGFLHAGFLHIGFNMYLLYLLGRMIEPAIGPVRFATLYFASLLAGACGALIVDPHALTVGASGAVFGLMGAAALMMRARGLSVMESGIGGLIVLNLAFSFIFSGISIGGHIGGLIGGFAAAGALEMGMQRRSQLLGIAGCLLVAGASIAGAVAAAQSSV